MSEGKCTAKATLTVVKRERKYEGSCCFCSSNHRKVWVITSDIGTLKLRLCNECFLQIAEAISHQVMGY